MPIAPEHAFKEKSTKLLILLPLRTIYNRTFKCETPCISNQSKDFDFMGQARPNEIIFNVIDEK